MITDIGRVIAAVLAVATLGGGLFVSRSARVFNDGLNAWWDLAAIVLTLLVLAALLTRAVTGTARGCALLLGGAYMGGLTIAHPLATGAYGIGFFGLTLVFAACAGLGIASWRILDRGARHA
ncbi:hypothetical protein [Actinomadura atramentaria]|uniref:hypothetical protein n=1 Tax=Actinomadura atramentaria TaxID=1990 RepID=UPI00036554B4|nr:hypothetical protein [Actinomadura atramentaria]